MIEKTFLVEVHCVTPDEMQASNVPDEYFNHFTSKLYDQRDRESCAYYRHNGYSHGFGPPWIELRPCIILDDDGFYTEYERKECYPVIEGIVAEASSGIRRPEHHIIVLPKKFGQKDFSAYAAQLEKNPFFRVVSHYVNYLHVPERLAHATGFPEEKIHFHEDGTKRLYHVFRRE